MAEIWRPGDFRVCPSCGARHKVQDLACNKCHTSLVGGPVRHVAPVALRTAGMTSNRTLRAVAAAGLILAVGAGLWVRSMFRGASVGTSVAADGVRSTEAPTAPAMADPNWTPPNLSYPAMPPMRPALTAIPPAGEPLINGEALSMPAPMAPVSADVPNTGMVSIAPSAPAPSGRTTFTDDDLTRIRTHGATGSAPMGASMPATAPAAPAVDDDKVRDWTERVRDRAEDVQEAKSKARRFETEVATLRARVAAGVVDEGEREKVEDDVREALDDLEKAERNVRDAERRLDESKADARREGVAIR